MRDQGVIKAIGAGVNEWQAARCSPSGAIWTCSCSPAATRLLEQEPLEQLAALCVERGIGIVLGGVFNSGILATGPVEGAWYNYDPAPPEILDRVRKLEAVCKRHGVRLIEAALQFPLAHPAVVSVIVGAKHPNEARSSTDLLNAYPARALAGSQVRRPDQGGSAGSGKRLMIAEARPLMIAPRFPLDPAVIRCCGWRAGGRTAPR